MVRTASSLLISLCSYNSTQGAGVFVTRHHKHHVQSDQDDTHAVRAFQARVHQRDRVYTYANPGRSTNIPPAERLRRETLQDQHETRTLRTFGITTTTVRQDRRFPSNLIEPNKNIMLGSSLCRDDSTTAGLSQGL